MKRSSAALTLIALILSACSQSSQSGGNQVYPPLTMGSSSSAVSSAGHSQAKLPPVKKVEGAFAANVIYQEPKSAISKDIAADFSTDEAKNLQAILDAYGITLSPAEKAFLAKNKFLMKQMTATGLKPPVDGDNSREFTDLYTQLAGKTDYKTRTQANAVYLSSDVFFNAYNNLFTELLKEMENKIFFPSMQELSKNFYLASVQKLKGAKTDADKKTWTHVRNYFAIPYAIFSNAAMPLTKDDYYAPGYVALDPAKVQADFKAKDGKVDTMETVSAFIKNLKLDAESQQAILADIAHIYKPEQPAAPEIFKKEFADYKDLTNIEFKVDFTQFTPRGTYTSSSLRRQYFRGMNWYIQVPFFVKSPDLTNYAFGMTQLMAEHPDDLARYNQLESAINFLVGSSDDLMPHDYLAALESAKGAADQPAAIMEYLVKARNPQIKSLAAAYDTIGVEESADVLLKTKGMRFFSGKFILDSYWTGQLTQGDEKVKPGYSQKLPPMASSLEVMALLGSDYAKSKIPTLDFYKPTTSKAIDQAMKELEAKTAKLDTDYWKSTVYNGWLWTIKGLFSFEKDNKKSLPAFMQSPMWDIKSLMTGAGFWTELRHATILYAKQSFAEKGGGGGCDTRLIPEAPKGYIEPQPVAYARLKYLADKTGTGLKDMGFELQNLQQLSAFSDALSLVQSYTNKELQNTTFTEKQSEVSYKDVDPQPCIQHEIDGVSDWEQIRVAILNKLKQALPTPTEGPILTAKDRRAAIIADVHTGGDATYDTHILYEGTGVPNVIIVAVKDANGPRYTIGLTYAQFEFTQLMDGKRMTDEDWQKKFYVGDDTTDPYHYTDKKDWPQINSWYLPILEIK